MFEAQIGKICLKHYTFNYNMVFLIYLLKYHFLKAHGLFFSNPLIFFLSERNTLALPSDNFVQTTSTCGQIISKLFTF